MSAALRRWAPDAWPVAEDWRGLVNAFLASPAGQHLAREMRRRLDTGVTIYPPTPFRALELTPLATVKVVILGQDPYHGPGQAQGLAFSGAAGRPLPPSLRNIFRELARDCPPSTLVPDVTGSLAGWARQGVLLLNTCLTVEQGQPNSHSRLGWDVLTNALLCAVVRRCQPVVFMLWGAQAQASKALLAACCDGAGARQLVLTANHPSPLSALRGPQPFIGCGHFGRANFFLTDCGVSPVDWWRLDDAGKQ